MKRGKLNAFKFLNLILVNHLTSRWFEVKFNFALVESTRRLIRPKAREDLAFVSYCIIHLIIPVQESVLDLCSVGLDYKFVALFREVAKQRIGC